MKYCLFLLLCWCSVLVLAAACSSPDTSSLAAEPPITAKITPRNEHSLLSDTTRPTAAQQARNYDGCP